MGRELGARERGPVLARLGRAADDVLPRARGPVLPELFVVGGGISKKSAEFLPLLEIDTPIVPAALRNHAGIVGAALYARRG